MIALIPVSQFRVSYDVGSGRPYSRFEALLLKAVAEGARSVDELREIFKVHPRLVVDGLVSLTREGWLAVGAGGSSAFVLTASGRTTLETGRVPESRLVDTKYALLVMERLSGSLARNDEVRYVADREMRENRDRVLRLRPEVVSNTLLEGQVERLLHRKSGQWLSSIGPIDMVTKGSWVPVTVDFDVNRVFGLPDSWTKLTDMILAEARSAKSRLEEEALSMRWEEPAISRRPRARVADDEEDETAQRDHPITIEPRQLLLGAGAHQKLLRQLLEDARHSVFISSSCIDRICLERLREPFQGALGRGILIDLLWGEAVGGSAGEMADVLKKMAYDCRQRGLTGELRFNSEPSRVSAEFLICDDACGAVGTAPWLCLPEADAPTRMVSIVVESGSLLVQLMRVAAGYWSTTPGSDLSSTGDRWRVFASRLDERLAQSKEGPSSLGRAHLVDGLEQEAEYLNAIRRAGQRVVVASAEPSVARQVAEGVRDGLAHKVADPRGAVGTVVVADDWVCLCSARANLYRLGIVLEVEGVADVVANALA